MNHRSRTIPIAGLLAAVTLAAGGCGDGGSAGRESASQPQLSVYSSFPLQGPQRSLAEAMVNGVRLALKQSGSRAGRFRIHYQPLDDSTAQAGNWDPGQTAANARRAAQDRAAVAYLGEFNSGASAVSMPILNAAGVPQVSPGNTAVGLTTDKPGAAVGEPEKYYPTGRRTYVRIVPNDVVQGAAVASLMQQEGCRASFVVHDPEIYGVGLAHNIEHSAGQIGLKLLATRGMDPQARNYRPLARSIRARGADCIAFAGTTPNNAVQLFKDLAAGVPRAKLFGTDGVAEATFADAHQGGLPGAAARRMLITAPTLAPGLYPPAGRSFFSTYEREYGDRPDPWAIYGYEAMELVLDAIQRAGAHGDDRNAVLAALRHTRGRRSALGTYSIDADGDTTLTAYGVYRIANSHLEFDRRVDPRR